MSSRTLTPRGRFPQSAAPHKLDKVGKVGPPQQPELHVFGPPSVALCAFPSKKLEEQAVQPAPPPRFGLRACFASVPESDAGEEALTTARDISDFGSLYLTSHLRPA